MVSSNSFTRFDWTGLYLIWHFLPNSGFLDRKTSGNTVGRRQRFGAICWAVFELKPVNDDVFIILETSEDLLETLKDFLNN